MNMHVFNFILSMYTCSSTRFYSLHKHCNTNRSSMSIYLYVCGLYNCNRLIMGVKHQLSHIYK